MTWPHTRLILFAAAACCAVAWWTLRSPAHGAGPLHAASMAVESTSIDASTVVTALAPAQQHPALELEAMAAMFAAEPALIDALEDATGAADPAVRDDAEKFLGALELPAPNPEIASDPLAAQ
jgi:hypothetical protein